jgi:hypothetical protein
MERIDRLGELRIEEVRPAGDREWDAVWARCDYATYFHSREWAELWQEYSNGRLRPDARVVTFSDRIRALLPLSVERVGRWGTGTRHRSSPAGTYGGWLSDEPLGESHAALLSRYLLELPGLVWRLNPFDALGAHVGPCSARPDHTRALRLAAGFDALVAGWSKGHRAAARKARREGVSIAAASSLDDWRSYYEIYRGALGRWRSPTSSYRWSLFEQLHARRSAHATLWLARRGGDLLAGALVFSAKRHMAYWHGCSQRDAERLRPVQLLMHEVVRSACRDGYAVFDFNPSGGHAGVDSFKKGFGADSLPSPVVYSATPSLRRRLGALLRPARHP